MDQEELKKILGKIYWDAKFRIILHMHFVVFLKRSILANSFGECILENTNVLPTAMHGECRNLTNENIGPVPADETLRIDLPKDSSAAFLTVLTNGSDSLVLAAASP